MADQIVLSAGGNVYEGWTKIRITRSLEAMAGSFDLELTHKWDGSDSKYKAFMKPIQQGAPCVVKIGNDKVITGYVDDWVPSYDDSKVMISVSGRDKTSDLIDCSIIYPSGQFKNQTFTKIAKTVCQPFGINVVVETDVGAAFTLVQIEQGETPHELLTRLATQRGVLLTTNGEGDLVITRASTKRAGVSLILGENIKAARGRFSWRERYSQFKVKGSSDKWDEKPEVSGGIEVTVRDSDISRYRPLIIMSDEITTADGASKRGQWERQRSIGRSNTAEYTVIGWRIPQTGKVWNVNQIVPVQDDIIGLNEDMLINTIMFSEEEDSGRIAVIGVVRPDALKIPPQEKLEAKDYWKGKS